jgi:transcription antitermination factor NusA-like protein
VYLEAEVQDYLAACAKARGIEVGQLVNELLKKDIELIEAAR